MLSAWQPPRFPVMSQLLVTGPAGPRGSPGERQVSCAPRWGRFVCSRLPQSWVARATGFPEAVSMMQASQGRAPGGGSGNWLLSPPPWAPGSSSLPSCGHRRPPADRGTWQGPGPAANLQFHGDKRSLGGPDSQTGTGRSWTTHSLPDAFSLVSRGASGSGWVCTDLCDPAAPAPPTCDLPGPPFVLNPSRSGAGSVSPQGHLTLDPYKGPRRSCPKPCSELKLQQVLPSSLRGFLSTGAPMPPKREPPGLSNPTALSSHRHTPSAPCAGPRGLSLPTQNASSSKQQAGRTPQCPPRTPNALAQRRPLAPAHAAP